jgi:ATP-dependent DNA helicase RecQ
VRDTVPTTALSVTEAEHRMLASALSRLFGHSTFRPGQEEAIASVLRGESVLTIMPTGAGKSLCYQLAAMLVPATTLVISPLVALMKDQLDGLPATIAAQATALNYTLDGAELESRLAGASGGRYKLVYAAPERLRQRPFLHALRHGGVSLLVVDEAHCVSMWGHDFRPDYRFISQAWQELGRPPIMALTATATPRVQQDIQTILGQMHVVSTGSQRANLRLGARRALKADQKREAVLRLCQELEGSGIVYASSRERCEHLAQLLNRAGISAIHYHAGIADRSAAQESFMSGAARVVVATVAFGMGIDKADVRFVIHYDPPGALENYYQEAGRAGRDGLPAHCILLYTLGDRTRLRILARRDLLGDDDLRAVYAAVQDRLGSDGIGPLALADLERDLDIEETRLRVAIHFLEAAGLVVRGFDLPRTVTLAATRTPCIGNADFERFLEAARLRPGQRIARDTRELSEQAGIPLDRIEAQLLAWRDARWLEYRGTGRDMFLTLPKLPPDSAHRVRFILANHKTGQMKRIDTMMSYAACLACRHGFISAYFGDALVSHCTTCDNCLGDGPRSSAAREERPPAKSRQERRELRRPVHEATPRRQPDSPEQAGDERLFQALRAWRLDTARRLGRSPFVIFHDSVLRAIAAERPRSLAELDRVRGVGPHKLESYGQEILGIVTSQLKTPDTALE